MKSSGKILYLHPSDMPSDTQNSSIPETPDTAADTDDSDISASLDARPYAASDDALWQLYSLIKERGMDPVSQLSGFIITEDPIYIPDYKSARSLAMKMGRDKLLFALLENFFGNVPSGEQQNAEKSGN